MGVLKYRYNNFYEMILSHASERGRKKALFLGKRSVSYAELLEMSDRLAAYLHEEGVREDERVALFMKNSVEFIVSLLAISKIGAVCVPVNNFLKAEELSYILEDSSAVLLMASASLEKVVRDSKASLLCRKTIWEGSSPPCDIHESSFGEILRERTIYPPVKRGLDECAVIFYTSGTTGKPKGAMLSYRNILSNAESAMMLFDISPSDRDIVFLPMFHSFTFSIGLILPLYAGASIVIVDSVRPFSNIFKQTLLKRVTVFFGVPDLYNALAKARLPWYFRWFNRVRIFVSGAAALQTKTLKAMREKFPRARILEGYGLSESSPAVCINPLHLQKERSVGPAMPGYEIKIVDENMLEVPVGETGEIIIRGDNVVMGYLERPEATAETIINAWLLTGDMGYMDSDGYLYIVDRKKDLIISKGINIYPREIEELIDAFPGVKASAVVGVENEKNGELPVAYIEAEDGQSVDMSELKRYLKSSLANYKIPRHMELVEELPKNATGKVLKRVLKERLAAKRGE